MHTGPLDGRAGGADVAPDVGSDVRPDAGPGPGAPAPSATAQRLEQVFRSTGVAMGLVGVDGGWLAVTDRLCEVLRTDAATLLRLTPRDLIHPDDRAAAVRATRDLVEGRVDSVDARRRYVGADGRVVTARVQTTLLRDPDGRPDSFLTQLHDADRRGGHGGDDPVTGLPGRQTLLAHAGRALGRSRRAGRTVVLVHVDLPAPAHGVPSELEDRLLACASQRLVGTVRSGDLVAAVDGRRLTVCCEGLADEADVPTVVGRVRRTLDAPVDVDGRRHRLRAEVGVAVAGRSETAEQLLARDGWPVAPDEPAPGTPVAAGAPAGVGRHRAVTVL
ncbi:PAS domain S-box protein [Aquipuribacter sp. SD81]|uniref:PAS domain S-box protein n=1 Tax=Aquipuribacter sp. SD81 TaxID=3127703 RepID=UPI003015918E